MLYITTAAQVKSVYLGLTPSKFFQEQTKFLLPSPASYDQTSLYRQNQIMTGLRKKRHISGYSG